MQSTRTPRLKGRALAALVALVENPATGPLIVPKILRDTGIGTIRDADLPDPPSVRPDLPQYDGVTEPDPAAARILDGFPPGARATAGLAFNTAADFARAYEELRVTPEDVAHRVLDAILAGDERDPPLRSMVAVQADDVLAQAKAATERFRQGRPLGPLDGVPVAVKDEFDQVPYPTTVGTRFLRERATEDAFGVARLRAAGAVLIGKANMHEVGIDVTGFNAFHGTPRNPYDTRRYTGGSSSGPAAAVAAGFCPLALGADGGGSIRIPAALCGVFGLKPTFGRVSERGAAPLAWSVAHVGPIAASARDLALGYAIIGGPDPRDPNTLRQPAPHLRGLGIASVDGLRIGVFTPWFEHADEEVVRTCRELLAAFQDLGARVIEVVIPDLELCRLAHGITILSEMATSLGRHDAAHRKDFSLATRLNLALARELTSRDFVRAQQVRTRMTAHFERAFETVDVIATPTCASTAPPIRPGVLPLGESDLAVTSGLMRFVLPSNLTGHPAVSVPAGYAAAGLPIGLQLIGRPWDEALLLRLAELADAAVERRSPALHFDLLTEAGTRPAPGKV
jgi:Asp-tRNA(Asn)/Glu-tRNA(Gln) amidotransferase A subunit family amidase